MTVSTIGAHVSSQGSPEPRAVPDVLAGRYRLEEQIGAGGAGTVWRASDAALGRPVAVKLLHSHLERDAETVARFRREATAAAKLTHPNAVVIYDIGEDTGRVYLVMELVAGPTLGDLLAAGTLSPAVVGSIGLQVARALGDAHARGLVHRDVKPANVLLTADGAAKVADFGIAKALGKAQTRLTTPGTVVGTAAYLAPEQLRSDGQVDARADVYALGLLLYECLTGEPPFSGGTAVEVATRRLADDPPPARDRRPDVPGDLDAVIRRATRRDVDERFPDGATFAATLEPLVAVQAQDEVARLVATVAGSTPAAATRTSTLPRQGAATTTQAVATGDRSDVPGGDDPAVTTVIPPAPPTTPTPGQQMPPDREREPQPPPTPRPDRGHDRRWLVAALLGLLGLALVVVLGTLGGEPGDPTASPEPTGGQTSAPAATAPLEIQDARDYDPLSSGGDEHPEEVERAFDGDPGTAWTTEGYNSADFGGLKAGVGIWFDLGEVRDVREVALQLTADGADVELYASEDSPDGDDLGSWGDPVAAQADAAADTRLEMADDAQGRYWLVWFTSLPQDGGRHRAGVAGIELTGPS